MTNDRAEPRDPNRGYGPVLVDDDGNKHQVTEAEALDAAACAAGLFIAMAAWDFSSHEEWILGTTHYWFGSGIRIAARLAGLAMAAWIWLMVAREARARELDPSDEGGQQNERVMNGRAFANGKRPEWDHE